MGHKFYTVLLFAYGIALVLMGASQMAAIWQGFVGALLFYKGRYFVFPYVSSFAQSYGLTIETPIVFHITFADVMLIILLYIILRNSWSEKIYQKNPFVPHVVLMCLLLVIGALSSMGSRFPEVSWLSLFKLGEYFLIFLSALIVFKNKQLRRQTLKNVLIFVIGNAVLIGMQKLHGGPIGLPTEDISSGSLGRYADENESLYRAGGIFFEPNLPATMMVMFLPLVTWWSVLYSRKTFFNLVPLFVLLFALLATASRVNWFLSAVVLGITVLFFSPQQVKQRASQLKKIVILVVIGLLSQFRILFDRILSLQVALTSDTGGFSFRLRHFEIAYDFMTSHLFGVGIDVFQYQILESFNPSYYFYHFTTAHNVLAEVGSGMGVLGLIVFVCLFLIIGKEFIALVRSAIQKRHTTPLAFEKAIAACLAVGYLAFMASTMFFPWLFAPPLTELSWIVLAMIYRYSKI